MIGYAVAIVLLPLAGSVAAVLRLDVLRCGWAAIVGGCGTLGVALALAVQTVEYGAQSAWDGFVYVDGLSAFFLVTVAIVTVLASLGSAAYLGAATLSDLQVRLYFAFFGLFAASMLASLETGNLGLLFVLIEASTLASVVLVGLEAKSASLEAAWKYVIISSLGVTIALVGTVYLFYSGSALHLGANLRLTWPYLYANAHALATPSLKLAFLLAVIGYGTKVGLAPMHTWLPDAHSEAPSPASAMLSAALLNTGMYAIIRFLAIARIGLGATYVRNVMLVFGFLSIAIAVLFMIRQGNYKRLFAYSSVEHMGIIAVALGFGGQLGMYGALLHTLNHAVGKATLFLSSGDVLLGYRTRQTERVRGVLAALPITGGALLLGSMAILGSPPFGLFLSELTIVRAGFASASPWLPGLLLALLLIAFVGFAHTITGMTLGEPPPDVRPYRGAAQRALAATPLLLGIAGLLVLGLWIPSALDSSILHAIGAVT